MSAELKPLFVCINQMLGVLMDDKAYRATKYLSPKLIIRATRRRYKGKIKDPFEVVLTMGKPNYAEREFIKKSKKAGESFPIKKTQLKY